MPSPDLTPYVDLSLYDLDAQTIFDLGLDQLKARVPGYNPRETNIEMILLEAFAYQIEQSVFAINRLPGTQFDILMQLFGVVRYLGAAPITTLKFTVATTTGHTIPAGTRAVLTTDAGGIIFTLTNDLPIPAGVNTATGPATAETFTSVFNGTPVGADLSMLDAVTYVDYVELASVVTGGADAETDDEWRTRATARFSRLTETLVLPSHFVQHALEQEGVFRAYGLDNYNPSVAGAVGSHPGYMTVAVYGNGAPLSAASKTALAAAMEDITAANLAVSIIDPTVTDVNVTATVRAAEGADPVWVKDSVEDALREYLNPSTWLWSGTVRRNELISVIDQALDVAFVESITTPSADVALTGNAPLARAGVLNITVTTA